MPCPRIRSNASETVSAVCIWQAGNNRPQQRSRDGRKQDFRPCAAGGQSGHVYSLGSDVVPRANRLDHSRTEREPRLLRVEYRPARTSCSKRNDIGMRGGLPRKLQLRTSACIIADCGPGQIQACAESFAKHGQEVHILHVHHPKSAPQTDRFRKAARHPSRDER